MDVAIYSVSITCITVHSAHEPTSLASVHGQFLLRVSNSSAPLTVTCHMHAWDLLSHCRLYAFPPTPLPCMPSPTGV